MSTPELNDQEGAGARLPVTWGWFRKILVDLTSATKEYTERALKPLSARIDALEKAAEELKANPVTIADAYKGVWMPGTTYQRGNLATWDGSLWLSLVDSEQKPGASSDWKMITKKGRDGKDAKP